MAEEYGYYDYRSCGGLFMLFYQELQDITFIKALALIVELFKEGMMKLLGITEAQIQSVVDYVRGTYKDPCQLQTA